MGLGGRFFVFPRRVSEDVSGREYRTGGRRRAMNRGYVACQICTVLSLLPETIHVPSGDQAREVAHFVCLS